MHAMAEFRDGSLRAEMATADMRLPIQLALAWPERLPTGVEPVPLTERPLTFEPVDREAFPAVDLAYRVGGLGLTFPAVMNAANEVAVMAFLEGKIALTRIVEIVQTVVDEHEPASVVSIVNIERADGWARRTSRRDHRGTLAKERSPPMNLLVGLLIFLPFITVIISLHEFGAPDDGPEVRLQGPRILRGVRSADLVHATGRDRVRRQMALAGWLREDRRDEPLRGGAARRPAADLRRQAHLAAGARDLRRPRFPLRDRGTHLRDRSVLLRQRDPNADQVVSISEVESTLNGAVSPARQAGLQPGDTIVAVGSIDDPTDAQLIEVMTAQAEDRPGEPIGLSVERDGTIVPLEVTPELSDVEGQTIGRVGVTIELVSERESLGASLVGGGEAGGRLDQGLVLVDRTGVRSARASAGSSAWCSPTPARAHRCRSASSASVSRSGR